MKPRTHRRRRPGGARPESRALSRLSRPVVAAALAPRRERRFRDLAQRPAGPFGRGPHRFELRDRALATSGSVRHLERDRAKRRVDARAGASAARSVRPSRTRTPSDRGLGRIRCASARRDRLGDHDQPEPGRPFFITLGTTSRRAHRRRSAAASARPRTAGSRRRARSRARPPRRCGAGRPRLADQHAQHVGLLLRDRGCRRRCRRVER